MCDHTPPDIAVVGAGGIIGVACALQLSRQGRQVLVIDAQGPGMGALSTATPAISRPSRCFPSPTWRSSNDLPAMLLDPTGPLRLGLEVPALGALPWFARLLLNLRPDSYRRTVAGLQASDWKAALTPGAALARVHRTATTAAQRRLVAGIRAS
ncbi:FAD-dependent oxidoreductase [Pseudomonas trivialis]